MALIHDDDLDFMFMDGAVRSYSISVDCTTLFTLSATREFPSGYSYRTPPGFGTQDISGLVWRVSTILQLHEPRSEGIYWCTQTLLLSAIAIRQLGHKLLK
jgi:hypothetical protein